MLKERACERKTFIYAQSISGNDRRTMTLREYTKGVRAGSNDFAIVETFELRETVVEEEFFSPDRTVPMFAHENIGNTLPFRVLIIHVLSINEHDDVGILLDCAALEQDRSE